jgi:hypothetical protein
VRIALLALTVLVATGCMSRSVSGGGTGTKPSATSLQISISLGGRDSPTKLWTLRCPGGGTLPNAARACTRLEKVDRPFAPLRKRVACTQVYGGPQVADVSGTFHGERVSAHFSRSDGCEIARWNKVRFLFPST